MRRLSSVSSLSTFLLCFSLSAFRLAVAQNSTNGKSNATEPQWEGCVMEGTDAAGTPVKIGQRTIVCVQIGNGTQWNAGLNYIRLAFEPEADQYSRLIIPNCKCACV